jgi:hypothetical protein
VYPRPDLRRGSGLRPRPDYVHVDGKLKIMPESVNIDLVQRIISELHPQVIAFGASDSKPEIVRLAKDSGAELSVAPHVVR